MKMYEVEVCIVAGDVLISQGDGFDDDATVVLNPEQVDLLCEWLKAAANEARGK